MSRSHHRQPWNPSTGHRNTATFRVAQVVVKDFHVGLGFYASFVFCRCTECGKGASLQRKRGIKAEFVAAPVLSHTDRGDDMAVSTCMRSLNLIEISSEGMKRGDIVPLFPPTKVRQALTQLRGVFLRVYVI
ncbi:hypothetical protein KC19_6G175900 [Ceratodon purpureus]|uniref:Uncharacterized protein n=1 Tax=Ceratodon purpureus TaxID=3225 RepID=A0A8T0HG69_CERPU|nr:hypothetical protein KC19_6G175900 [Ceratodon purpureus]